jgi:hypothetical protein
VWRERVDDGDVPDGFPLRPTDTHRILQPSSRFLSFHDLQNLIKEQKYEISKFLDALNPD